MRHEVEAIYEHGVFRPLAPLLIAEGTMVHLRVADDVSTANEQSIATPDAAR